jgi:D-glycero-alpha-D-manno-heptose-7-phosphate kinase
MIITATPYRISFFGGGTDYPVWFRDHGGAVLATTINRYCYLSCRYLPPFFEFKHRIVWSRIELANSLDDIVHPAVREAIRLLEIEEGLEVHHDGDLPARAGLGSSSAFAVGILHALYALKGMMVSKAKLAKDAIHLEQNLVGDCVGVQDQIVTAAGGLNLVEIERNGDFRVHPLPLPPARKLALEEHLLLFYTGTSRTSSEVAKQQIKSIPAKQQTLKRMQELAYEAKDVLMNGAELASFGRLLHETWQLKRSITDGISTSLTDEIYDKAMAAGAAGGKVLGAGGGGFMLFFVAPERRLAVMEALSDCLLVPFEMENAGTRVTVYEPEVYTRTALHSRDFRR